MSFKLGNIIRLTSLTNKTQSHIFRPITVHLVTDAAVTLKYLCAGYLGTDSVVN